VTNGARYDLERTQQQNGITIDHATGERVQPDRPPPWQQRPQWRRQSNMQRAMEGGDE
jgi:hypothetical protein